MPWCPNCKKEYDEKKKTCNDCDMTLYHSFYQSEDKALVEKLKNFFSYSDLESVINYNDKNGLYVLSISDTELEKGKKLYQAFHYMEKELLEKATDSLEDEGIETTDNNEHNTESESNDNRGSENSSTAYVSKEDTYNDYKSTTSTFLFFGIAGLVFVFLNIIGVISLINGLFSNLVMGALFVFFLYIGVNTMGKAKNLKAEVEVEKQSSDKINNWLEENINKEYLDNIQDDDQSSQELKYFKHTEAIKKDVINDLGKQNPDYLDKLIEDFYNENF